MCVFTKIHKMIRRLEKHDYTKGYCELLNQLSDVGTTTQKQFDRYVDEINSSASHEVFVIAECSTILGSITLLFEPKLIHSFGTVMHIEDVVIDKKYRGLGLGSKLIQHAVSLAEIKGCYKIVLYCSSDRVGFYEKLKFRHKANTMMLYR